MAKRFNLKELKTTLETEFIESFDYSKKEDYLVIAERFELTKALVFEKKILPSVTNLFNVDINDNQRSTC